MNQLWRYDSVHFAKHNNVTMKPTLSQERKYRPCVICESLGKSGQFHYIEACKNKSIKKSELNRVNIVWRFSYRTKKLNLTPLIRLKVTLNKN